MDLVVRPGSRIEGRARVPGDKSIAHRWLILAACARGRSSLADVPPSLDVRSTAACLAALFPRARPGLDAWSSNAAHGAEANGFTWDERSRPTSTDHLEVEGEGRGALSEPVAALDCGNSGTTMRLIAGVVAGAPVSVRLVGDASLSRRPMDRVAEPLRAMGADVRTADGHPPLEVRGGALRGISYRTPVPSAQVKGAILFAGCAAEGVTSVAETAATRDHTERALAALGGPVSVEAGVVRVAAFEPPSFAARVPGDVSSAAFLLAAAAVTGGEVEVEGVGLNPSRTFFLEVMRRMGVQVEVSVTGEEVGEPLGSVVARGPASLSGVDVAAREAPLAIDEVPALAAVAAHATSPSRFVGAGELRVKESDRLAGVAAFLAALGGSASVEGDDLIVAGGGLGGGRAASAGDHRIAMAAAVAALAASGPSTIEGVEAADVSFPGFGRALEALAAGVEVRT
jgi:3-phosphoshikimate 1-carboxyvinyltransferase